MFKIKENLKKNQNHKQRYAFNYSPAIIIFTLILSSLVPACSSTSEVISGDIETVSVAMSDTSDFNEAIEIASQKAQKHCGLYSKTAKLDRTEKTGTDDHAGVAYYTCK